MVFEKDKMYAITSTLGNGETKVYTIGKDEVKLLKDTKDLNIYYLDYWFEKASRQRSACRRPSTASSSAPSSSKI